ncbi:RagB/SusD family nutrient uptake outer membrane protein [Pedobacter sp. L105]|uniref:RagB/SusD family nutrient uptake outer membrane protein n=1 Tax=Pedobacter sp. L105 TaxID=1641871 RepID=UPI00131E2E6E|nr:RagB/SusD family nutrient uptake outer membrane protein [Pedobacter sp. L105]
MKKKYLLILGFGVLLNCSCKKDLLYPVSQTQVSDQNYQPFSTSDRIQSQVLGLYNSLRDGRLLGGRFQVYNDVKADNWINFSNNQVTASNTWSENVNTTSQEVTGLWAAGYAAINNANLFIDGMAAKGTSVVGDATGKQYVGEAKFVRAISYYCLLQLYARPYVDGNGSHPGLPLRLNGISSYGNLNLARSTVSQIYDQIILDLNDAEAALPLSYSTNVNNVVRAHRNTAIALKTRVYLTMARYSDVITEANKIVSATAPFTAAGGSSTGGVDHALAADVASVFRTPYTTTESIFSMPFSATEGPGTQNGLGYYFYQNGGTPGLAEFYLNPTGVIADPNWKATDKRRTELLFTNTSTNRTYTAKYTQPDPYADYAPVIRYAEVLLNLAEAKAHVSGVDPQAVALLNAVRNRSDASTTYTAGSFASSDALVSAILQERNIEFLGEGLRNIDLMRTLSPIPAKGSVPAIPTTDPRYIWPISGDELLYNNLMTNN